MILLYSSRYRNRDPSTAVPCFIALLGILMCLRVKSTRLATISGRAPIAPETLIRPSTRFWAVFVPRARTYYDVKTVPLSHGPNTGPPDTRCALSWGWWGYVCVCFVCMSDRKGEITGVKGVCGTPLYCRGLEALNDVQLSQQSERAAAWAISSRAKGYEVTQT